MIVLKSVMKQPNFQLDNIKLTAFSICSILALLLAGALAVYNFDSHSQAEIAIQGKVNPNIATSASLVRLPGIGQSKAQAIINYRAGFSANNVTARAFEKPDDMANVSGIGPKTVMKLTDWLMFE